MKTVIASLTLAATALLCSPALTHGGEGEGGHESKNENPAATKDARTLYEAVRQARAELRALRQAAGVHPHAKGPHIDPEGHHANDDEAQRKREQSEGEGHEDGEGREGEGHEGREGREGSEGERGHSEGKHRHGGREHRHGKKDGNREGRGEHEGREGRRSKGRHESIAKLAKYDHTYRNGARLILQYNPRTQAFIGSVQNTTKNPLSQVRVEIHLSNGRELGPTQRADLKPGQKIPVELSALDQEFKRWVTHPEAGKEEEHGPGEEEAERHGGHVEREGRGEHDGGDRSEHEGRRNKSDSRPKAGTLRAVHNQVLLLQGELRAFKADLKAKK